ncbi:MAG: response regulator, partial [Anaerovorax sp.]
FTAERLITQKGKAYFRFVVADTGMGIAKEFMAGLFTAYAQEDVSIAQNYGGSGLGLAITKNLVTMMDGTIHAESEKGKGTVFTVELPFEIIESLITVDDKGDCDQEKLRDRGCFKGKRLLLAEDNEMNLEIATDILTTAGFMVETANNGRLAVEKFTSCEAEYYDAILMDVQMPELNGYEATRAIRASCHAEAKIIPIIAMTANAFAEDVASALASGMNDHIAKPIDLDQLYSVMRKYMEGGGPK